MGTLFTVAYGAFLGFTGSNADDIQQAFSSSNPDAFYTVAVLAIGGAGSFLGGYVCARIARHREYTLAVILTAISLALGWWLSPEEETAAYILMGTVVTVALTPAGAWYGAQRNRARR